MIPVRVCITIAVMAAGLAAETWADEAMWAYSRSIAPGSGESSHVVRYMGPQERGVGLWIECRASMLPTVHLAVEEPGSDLRQIKFDQPVPIVVRLAPPSGNRTNATSTTEKTAPGDTVRVSGLLAAGVTPYSNQLEITVGLEGAVAVADALTRADRPDHMSRQVIVGVGRTSAGFGSRGVRQAVAELRHRCGPWPSPDVKK